MESTNNDNKSALIHFGIFFKKFDSDRKRGKNITIEYAALMAAFIEHEGLNADFQEFISQVAVDSSI